MNDLSYKTAISRKKLSRPTRLFEPYLEGEVLDFGCGRGTDADLLGADKYDSHYSPEIPTKIYGTVLVVYVLNTVYSQRIVLLHAMSFVKPGGLIMVACRTPKEVNKCASLAKWTVHGTGWVTGSGTYQQGLSSWEIKSIIGWEVIAEGESKFSYVIARKPE